MNLKKDAKLQFLRDIRNKHYWPSAITMRGSVVSKTVKIGVNARIVFAKVVGDGIAMGDYFAIAEGSRVLSKYANITIGDRVSIGPNCLVQNYSHNLDYRITNTDALAAILGEKRLADLVRQTASDITIGDDVWIGQGVIILPGVTIGDGAVIGANSVVGKDIPPWVISAGAPAKVIAQRQHLIEVE